MPTTYPKTKMLTKDLQVGDTVTCLLPPTSPWSTCLVKQITDEWVTLWRPYGTTADWTMANSVICYMGLEEYKVERAREVYWYVWQRENLGE